MGRWRSGLTHETVNLAAVRPSGVRIPLYPHQAKIAQLVEHPHGKGKVASSNLAFGSRLLI